MKTQPFQIQCDRGIRTIYARSRAEAIETARKQGWLLQNGVELTLRQRIRAYTERECVQYFLRLRKGHKPSLLETLRFKIHSRLEFWARPKRKQ